VEECSFAWACYVAPYSYCSAAHPYSC
jgi:hypothetical protein